MTGQISYRKTQKGEWVVMGSASQITAGTTVKVSKKDGSSKTEFIAKVGNPFSTAQGQMVYGYLAPRQQRTGRGYCDECSEYVAPGTRCWETGMVH